MDSRGTIRIGVAMNGVTGRMGTNQHLIRSILAIRDEGGMLLNDGRRILPDPILLGRNPQKLEALALRTGVPYSLDLDAVLADPGYTVYFDAQATSARFDSVKAAIAAGKHVYMEKPAAASTAEALELLRLARERNVRHGVVQDKLWLPGLRRLKLLIDQGFFGRILSVRGEFGYWVFEGDTVPAQRPSWNYRKAEGGGIIVDMLCHWRYVLDNLFGKVRAVCCTGANHISRRWDEQGRPYEADADDAAYATFELEGGIVAHFNSSWCVRVRRDDLLTVQVDGTEGSAVAGLRECRVQHRSFTPKPVWNPDEPQTIDFNSGWSPVPERMPYKNAFREEWELFLRHVVLDEPFPWDLREGAKGIQLAELGLQSWSERRWLDVPELD